MKNIVYIATSIDGYIADKDGGIEWLNIIPNPANNDFGWSNFLSSVDAIVMGKNTFEMVISLGVEWPYPNPVFVVSNSMQEIPEGYEEKVEIIKGTPQEICSLLNSKGHETLYIDGGSVIQQFLKADLIDEMIITKIPILIGEGIPLFTKFNDQLVFELVETKILLNQLVQIKYKRKM